MQGFSLRGRLLRDAPAMLLIAVLPAVLLGQEPAPRTPMPQVAVPPAPAPVPPPSAQFTGSLSVRILSGDGAVNNVVRYTPNPTEIEVRDEADQLVPGASITFTFPATGPSGRFADSSRTWTTMTDNRGRVLLSRFVPNRLEGSYQILVNATLGERTGTALIRETNVVAVTTAGAPKHLSSSAKVLIVLGVGAAVAAGSLLAIKGGSVGNNSTVPTTTISIGTISIGAPH
jgi:hypothetical protein